MTRPDTSAITAPTEGLGHVWPSPRFASASASAIFASSMEPEGRLGVRSSARRLMPLITAQARRRYPLARFPGLGFANVALAGNLIKNVLEIARLSEVLVDRRKTYISDIVQLAQLLHHQLADLMRWHVVFALAFQFAHNRAHQTLDGLRL